MIAETVRLPTATDTAQAMFSEKRDRQLRNIPLSNNKVSRRIADTWSEGLEEQPIEKLRKKRFFTQLDEATDYSGIGHLVAYVRYADATTMDEDVFCKK
jgi:hypothetical protein